MVSTVIMARAGAGKTHHIAHDFRENESTLFITFTNQNVDNIRDEIHKRFNEKPPKNYRIITFSSFLYSWIIRPLEIILPFDDKVTSKGVDIFSNPSEPTKEYNPFYIKDNYFGHYMNMSNQQYYVSRLSKLIMKHFKNDWGLIESRLSTLVEKIYIDEFQDYKGSDFEIIEKMLKFKSIDVVAVGDFYQHSVAPYRGRSQIPYKKSKKDVSEFGFIESLPKRNVTIDTNSLKSSWRVTEDVCNFISNKLNIDITSSNKNKGIQKVIDNTEELEVLLNDSSCTKLVYSGASDFPYKPSINWSYSKGDTYKKTLIILTDRFRNIFDDSFMLDGSYSQSTINKLYVGLTRSNDETYICTKNIYEKYLESVHV